MTLVHLPAVACDSHVYQKGQLCAYVSCSPFSRAYTIRVSIIKCVTTKRANNISNLFYVGLEGKVITRAWR